VIRIGIIGASGVVGQYLTEHLRKNHFDVIPLSRNPKIAGYTRFSPGTDNWRILGKLDVLINCAGIIRESKATDFFDAHVQLVKNIVSSREILGNPKIIHFSVLGADESNPIAFLKSKGVGDLVLKNIPETYILRPSIICLPNNPLVQKLKLFLYMGRLMLNRPPVPKGFLVTKIQPVMAADVAECVEKIALHGWSNQIIPCAGPEAISFKDLIDMSSSGRGKKTMPVEIPKSLVEPITKNFISVWFPEILSYDQFQLLFKDNVDTSFYLNKILGRSPHSTIYFWRKELA